METVFKTKGVVGAGGSIATANLPFEEGQEVDVEVSPRVEVPQSIRKDRARAFEDWMAEVRREPARPTLSDHAMSRDSIYEDCGL